MASSQVEIPCSQGFGFILRDRNQNSVVSQKNSKASVKDHHPHHHVYISPVSDENSENLVDSWVKTQNQKNDNNNDRVIRLMEKPMARKSRGLASPVESVSRNEKPEELKRNGASSLVQIWEARLKPSNGGNSPSHNQTSSRSDSGVSVQDSHSSDGDSDESETKNGEIGFGSQCSVSDSGSESKWGRVADLIRKLSNEDKLTGGDGLSIIRTPRPYVSSCSSSEKTNFPMVSFSPKLRGRQAFTDLLMQMERDRHRELDSLHERNAVSKFTQRGRLQSMLRLRNLNRCLAIQDRNRFNAKSTGLNRIESGSAVQHLREKFRANAVSPTSAHQKKDHHLSDGIENKTAEETKATTKSTSKPGGGITTETCFTERVNMCNRKMEEAMLCKEKETLESKMNCLQQQETRAAYTCNKGESQKREEKKTSLSVCVTQESRLQQNQKENMLESCVQETQTHSMLNESNEIDQCLELQETSYMNGWEDQEEYEYEPSYYGETKNDWVSEISRPRSHWEELRKSRYLEVMNTRSEKEDIRRLLERRTVTDFLESGLREQIDKLMMSRVQTHSNKHFEKWELQQDEEEEEENGNEGEIKEEEEEEPLAEDEEQDDRDDSSRSSSSHMFASSPAGSWSSQDTGVTSPHILSVHNPQSPDMDLISCMRSQIQQLQQEMSSLRDSVKMCLDANASLRQSVHRENPLKRKCCLCKETQVEAVLYRCGHMCTCLKCANELHWNGGKCPICRAQIMDVVRVFIDTRN